MTAAEFDWSDSIAIPSQSAIAVYVDENFNLVLRQQNLHGEADSVLLVARQNCLALCETILREAGEHRFKIAKLPDEVIIGRDGNRMHIPEIELQKLDRL
jgi:hypothetical protein